jgi:hypothetical protein
MIRPVLIIISSPRLNPNHKPRPQTKTGVQDLGHAFPTAYTRAVTAHLPTLTLPDLLPVLSGFLFVRAAFHATPDAGLLASLTQAAVKVLKAGDSLDQGPDTVLPLLVAFALLGADDEYAGESDELQDAPAPHARYDPAPALELLTMRAHGALERYPPEAARLVLETLSLPGHSFRPRVGVVAAFTRRGAGQPLTDPADFVAAAQSLVRVVTRGATAEAEGAVDGLVDFLRLRIGASKLL